MEGKEKLSQFLSESRRGPATATIRIGDLKFLSDALLATLRKADEKEPMQKFIERVGTRLSGRCPKCGQTLAGRGIVAGAMAMESENVAFGGGSSGGQRFVSGKCFNPSCDSEEVTLSLEWKGAGPGCAGMFLAILPFLLALPVLLAGLLALVGRR